MSRPTSLTALLVAVLGIACGVAVFVVMNGDATTSTGDEANDPAKQGHDADTAAPEEAPTSPVGPTVHDAGAASGHTTHAIDGDVARPAAPRRVRVDPWRPLRGGSAWQEATLAERREAVKRVEYSAPKFEFVAFGGSKRSDDMATFRHAASAMEFVLVPAGSFVMGSPDSETHHRAGEVAHEVTLTSAFLIATTEVTQSQWVRVMGSTNPSRFRGGDLPVERVSWLEARAFCTTVGLSLPSEAQWERACRAESTTAYAFGDRAAALDEHAWYAGTSEKRSHPVGTKRPNALGIFDMLGNVYEWCEDGHRRHDGKSAVDPVGPTNAFGRVIRGGSWMTGADGLRSAARKGYKPESRMTNVGFRPAKTLPLDR